LKIGSSGIKNTTAGSVEPANIWSALSRGRAIAGNDFRQRVFCFLKDGFDLTAWRTPASVSNMFTGRRIWLHVLCNRIDRKRLIHLVIATFPALVVSLLGLAPAAAAAKVVYVSASQTNSLPDGISWATAFTGVQQGLDAAVAGDEVWVAAATYFENILLGDGVALLGGFGGDESDSTQRNWTTNLTILDGRATNSVVIVQAGAMNTTRLDGFTIQNGRAFAGAGVLCANASPIIANNTIVSNRATGGLQDGGGGGIHCTNSTALIANNRFLSNLATNGAGGGIACLGNSPTIVSNLFLENSAWIGGAIRCNVGSPVIAHNRILNNRAGAEGGGMELLNCSSGVIRHNVIRGNAAPGAGGAITCWFSSPLIINNVILGNLTTDVSGIGGGIYSTILSNPQILNNTIVWNEATRGGNIYCEESALTIANNIVAFGSSGIQSPTGLTLKNNCVFGNGINNYVGFADPTGTNGNISIDPQLIANPAYPGFHLLPSSPCRDAGDSSLVRIDWQDIDDQPRIQGATVDIGADESDGTIIEFSPPILRVSSGGDDANDGSSWGQPIHSVQTAIDRLKIPGGEIWVQAGMYAERIILAQMVHLFGGFNGTETNRNQRDWSVNVTVLDGGRLGSVVTANSLLGWNTVDGFVITNGQAARGGGIYCEESSPPIANNVLTGNIGGSGNGDPGGGAIYCRTASPFITNNWIVGNRAQSGGGIYCVSSSFPLIANNVILGNMAQAAWQIGSAVKGGGGINSYSSGPMIRNNFIAYNVATNLGSAKGFGGGVCISGSRGMPQIINNTFLQNQGLNGNGVENGGGIYCQPVNPIVVNNLIAFGSSGVMVSSGVLLFSNNCTFGNAAYNFQGVSDPTGTDGNISVDPLFLNPVGDYHLAANSPCIGAGDDGAVEVGWLDLDGQPRINGAHVDIGADETVFVTIATLLSITMQPANQLVIHVEGSSGSQHVVQSSPNLSVWTPVWTNQTVPFDYNVQNVSVPGVQFYRVLTAP